MNILILSASTGAGHMRASHALESYILKNTKDTKIEIVDTLKYINPLLNKTVTKGYVYLATKKPKVYGKLYTTSNKNHRVTTSVSKLNNLFSTKLIPLINEFNPDVIITTHPFPTEMISNLKHKGIINLPLICIMTDYAPHKAWINNKVDGFVVANEDMKNEMKSMGIPEKKIHAFGIPIDDVFFKRENKISLLKSLELDSSLPTILIMAGSFGVTNILEIYNNMIKIPLDFQVVVITGRNERLFEAFNKAVPKSTKKTKLIFFTDEVNKYMHAADLIITKPGGLTISEALACNIPMAVFDAIPGQEEENAEFLIKHNMAISLEKGHNCTEVISSLLKNKEKLESMKISCKSFDKSNSTKNILYLINKIYNNYKTESTSIV